MSNNQWKMILILSTTLQPSPLQIYEPLNCFLESYVGFRITSRIVVDHSQTAGRTRVAPDTECLLERLLGFARLLEFQVRRA